MENQKNLQLLNDCSGICNACYKSCLYERDTMMARCIELTKECAGICQHAATMLACDSENADKFLNLCAEVCEACAEECEKYDLVHCRQCAHICRKCSEMCFAYQPQIKNISHETSFINW